MTFFKENLNQLQNENVEHMPIGFEVAFPSLLDMARGLNIEVPDNSPILNKIFAMRNVKLTRYLSCGHNDACQRVVLCAHVYFHNRFKATLSRKLFFWESINICIYLYKSRSL